MLNRRHTDALWRAVAPVAFSFALAGCDLTGPKCTLQRVAGIQLELRDATTGAVIIGRSVEARAVSGAFVDSTTFLSPLGMVSLAHERPGRYTVFLTVEGFATWSEEDIIVQMDPDRCHVRTEKLTVQLEPVGGANLVRKGPNNGPHRVPTLSLPRLRYAGR